MYSSVVGLLQHTDVFHAVFTKLTDELTQQSHGRNEWKNILLKAKEHMTILLKH